MEKFSKNNGNKIYCHILLIIIPALVAGKFLGRKKVVLKMSSSVRSITNYLLI